MIDERRFIIHFQPILSVRGRTFFGVEALIRGVSADGTPISPALLFERADAEGLGMELDRLARQRFMELSVKIICGYYDVLILYVGKGLYEKFLGRNNFGDYIAIIAFNYERLPSVSLAMPLNGVPSDLISMNLPVIVPHLNSWIIYLRTIIYTPSTVSVASIFSHCITFFPKVYFVPKQNNIFF